MKTKTFYVAQKDGTDCAVSSHLEVGLAHKFELTGAVVGKCPPRQFILLKNAMNPTLFNTEKQALKAIERTEKLANKYRGTLADEIPKLKPLMERGVFTVRKAHS